MTNNTLLDQITAIAAPLVESSGLALWGVEYASGASGVLRIYIDSPDGVSIENCADISRLVGLSLDVEDIIEEAYLLEVSSPGLERAFFKPEQLGAYLGKTVEVSLKAKQASFPGRKNFIGKLSAYNPEGYIFQLAVQPDGPAKEIKTLEFTWDSVKKAHLVYVFSEEADAKSAAPKAPKAPKPAKNPKKSEKKNAAPSGIQNVDKLEE